MQRRDFLLASLAALGAAGCVDLSGPSPTPALAPGGPPWDQLARSLQGPLLLPGAPGFGDLAAPWNLRYLGRLPAGLARCQSVSDVQACLAWAQANGVPLVARCGGHSYAGYSLTAGLMIDVSPMSALRLDPQTGILTAGAGARNSDVYALLRQHSRSVTHGRCGEVGLAGFLLGGGIGFNMRSHGMACDQLLETEAVTADGRLRIANEQQETNLFWAARGGGGGNFAIHTSFQLQTFPVDTVTVYNLSWTINPRAAFEALLQRVATAPEALGCKVSVIATAGGLMVELLGQLHGTEQELATLLSGLPAPSQSDIRTLPYWEGQDFLDEDGSPEYSHERSRYGQAPLSSAAVDTIFAFLAGWPGTSVAATWKFFLQGGRVAALAPDATAYVHRQSDLLTSIELEWTTADSPELVARNQAWLTDFHEAMRPFLSERCYQNFIDASQTDFLRAYYGENLERLVAVKNLLDPGNVFQFPQSIPLQL